MHNIKVCIVGMGYVGLTLSVIMAEKGFYITGIEVNAEICDELNKRIPHFHEKRVDVLLKKHLNNKLIVQKYMPQEHHDVFIICVGTPINKLNKTPVLDYVIRASEEVSKHINNGDIVILRSTVPVGTTRNVVKPILDKSGKKYMLAFCPERTAEGNAVKELLELPQIVGGIDEQSVDKASYIFRKIISTIIEVSSVESAEMIKLLNNSYRDLNFAFANEVALMCEALKLDAVETIRAANLGYPRSNIPIPGFVGGACLEKDPYILAHISKENSYTSKLILAGRSVNEALPNYVVNKVKEKILNIGKKIQESKIFIMGFGFKGDPETDDMRGSLTLELVKYFNEFGCTKIYGHDFVVRESELKKEGVIPLSIEDGFKNADCIIFANNHHGYSSLDIEKLIASLNKPAIFIDIWYLFKPNEIKRDGIIYGGLGVD